jgi:hypothetical protein
MYSEGKLPKSQGPAYIVPASYCIAKLAYSLAQSPTPVCMPYVAQAGLLQFQK